MTIPTLTLWSLMLVALFTSIFALSAVLRSSDRSLSRQLSALSSRLKEAETNLDELSSQLRAMRQRENMRAYRNRKAAGPEPDEEPDPREWVKQTNKQLALSRLGVKP